MSVEHGFIITPKIYHKVVEPVHFMRKFNGFGISKYVLKKLRDKNVKYILFTYRGGNGVINYMTTLKRYRESVFEYLHNGVDVQKFVSIKDMWEVE